LRYVPLEVHTLAVDVIIVANITAFKYLQFVTFRGHVNRVSDHAAMASPEWSNNNSLNKEDKRERERIRKAQIHDPGSSSCW